MTELDDDELDWLLRMEDAAYSMATRYLGGQPTGHLSLTLECIDATFTAWHHDRSPETDVAPIRYSGKGKPNREVVVAAIGSAFGGAVIDLVPDDARWVRVVDDIAETFAVFRESTRHLTFVFDAVRKRIAEPEGPNGLSALAGTFLAFDQILAIARRNRQKR